MASLTQCTKGGDETGRPGWLIKFEYEETVVESVKKAIPHTERRYYPFTHTWWFSEQYAGAISKLFGNFDSLAYLQKTLF